MKVNENVKKTLEAIKDKHELKSLSEAIDFLIRNHQDLETFKNSYTLGKIVSNLVAETLNNEVFHDYNYAMSKMIKSNEKVVELATENNLNLSNQKATMQELRNISFFNQALLKLYLQSGLEHEVYLSELVEEYKEQIGIKDE
ncbi:MAG: hypothetical protein ACRCUP_01300 [Mycoplasmatales bacterium]